MRVTFLSMNRETSVMVTANQKFVSYLRVSTERQGHSGLGLEAQRKAVLDYLNGGNWTLVAEFVETESGAKDDRPELAAAMATARWARSSNSRMAWASRYKQHRGRAKSGRGF